MDEVTVLHARPSTEPTSEDWGCWLHEQLAQHPGIPVIALGKAASQALEGIEHTILPHPYAIRHRGDRGEIERKSKAIRKSLTQRPRTYTCPIFKADDEKRIVYGVVLEPDTRDLQGDVLGIDTIEEAAHKYLIASRLVGDSHSRSAAAEVVESYLAPADIQLGGQSISKGTWIMGVHITDEEMWRAVKAGEYTGFSIGGTGERKQLGTDLSPA